MALTEKQKEDLAARKAINEAKRAKKPATKATKKKENQEVLEKNISLENTQGTEIADKSLEELQEKYADFKSLTEQVEAEPYSESITDVLEQEATNVLPEGENVSTTSVDSLRSIPTETGLKIVTDNDSLTPNMDELQKKLDDSGLTISGITLVDNTQSTTESVAKEIIGIIDALESGNTIPYTDLLPDCSIDFTNGRSKPAVSTLIGGYGSQEGTYFDKFMREVVYILTLGGKFDRTVAPRFSSLPLSCKMKVPVEKYMDYVNRVGYPDYNSDKETYKVSLSAPDFRVLINSLEKHVELGWEVDPKQATLHKGRYVVPFRLRFPVENTSGLHCKMRSPIKYTVEELRELQWNQVKGIAKVHGIEETNHNAVISQLMTIMENIDE